MSDVPLTSEYCQPQGTAYSHDYSIHTLVSGHGQLLTNHTPYQIDSELALC